MRQKQYNSTLVATCEFSPSVTAKTARAATPMRMTNATDRVLFTIVVGSVLRSYPRFWP